MSGQGRGWGEDLPSPESRAGQASRLPCPSSAHAQASDLLFTCRTRSFTIPLYFGRIGLLPFGVPLDVVVGAPLQLPKWEGERWLGGGEGVQWGGERGGWPCPG